MTMDWDSKTVLVTGACGTVGRRLVRVLLDVGVPNVIALDNSESQIYELGELYSQEDRVRPVLGDIREHDSLASQIRDVHVVLHGAALKHVNLGEQMPDEIVRTNILGLQNVIHAARSLGVEALIFMSSDKAVNPTNVMGTSKLMGERLISAANRQGAAGPIFASTRFGNVLGATGSVVPSVMRQIESGGPVHLTDVNMTRFVMTVDEAVRLLIVAVERARNGEVFVTKMPALAIKDLIQVVVELYAPVVGRDPKSVFTRFVGRRPGEKLYEELVSGEETSRVVETDEFFVIYPALGPSHLPCLDGPRAISEYRSDAQSLMTIKNIRNFFMENNIIENIVATRGS